MANDRQTEPSGRTRQSEIFTTGLGGQRLGLASVRDLSRDCLVFASDIP